MGSELAEASATKHQLRHTVESQPSHEGEPVRRMVVGSSADVAEREADAVAAQVTAVLQYGDSTSASVPPSGLGSNDCTVRRSASVGAAGGTLDNGTARAIDQVRSGGSPLEPTLRRSMEGAFGADFSNVRLHVGGTADALADQIQAKAFTTGRDVFVRRSEYAPSTASGQHLLAHELAHTVQQGSSTIRRSPAGTSATQITRHSRHQVSLAQSLTSGTARNDTTIHRLMTPAKFKKKSGGLGSGKRKRIIEVDTALTNVSDANSKSVALTAVIDKCNAYLQNSGIDSTRRKGVTALCQQAVLELAQWRMRARLPLPDFVFRMDSREPEVIAKVGFQPWKPTGTISLIEHVRGALDSTTPEAGGEGGRLAKKHSQFVSTAADLEFAKDPTLSAGLLNQYFYRIDTHGDPDTYTDVGEHFDSQGVVNPYERQLEFAKTGGVPAAHVVDYCKGKDVLGFVLDGGSASDITWTAMPAPT